jgi:hypothetical protein
VVKLARAKKKKHPEPEFLDDPEDNEDQWMEEIEEKIREDNEKHLKWRRK